MLRFGCYLSAVSAAFNPEDWSADSWSFLATILMPSAVKMRSTSVHLGERLGRPLPQSVGGPRAGDTGGGSRGSALRPVSRSATAAAAATPPARALRPPPP